MGNERTKVDALKKLGEKVTGATLVASENETVVGMIDKIADSYSGGGGGGGVKCYKFNTLFGANTTLDIENEEDTATLNEIWEEFNQNPGTLYYLYQDYGWEEDHSWNYLFINNVQDRDIYFGTSIFKKLNTDVWQYRKNG